MGSLSNYGGAPKPPRRRPGDEPLDPHRPEPLHSLEPSPELAEQWERVRAHLQEAVGEFLWHIWIQHPQAVYRNGWTLYVEAPERMFVSISERYNGHILMAARETLGEKITIEYVRHGWRPEGHEVEQPAGQRKAEEMPETQRQRAAQPKRDILDQAHDEIAYPEEEPQKRGPIANAPAKALERTAEALVEEALEQGVDETSELVQGLRESAEQARASQDRPARRRRSDVPPRA